MPKVRDEGETVTVLVSPLVTLTVALLTGYAVRLTATVLELPSVSARLPLFTWMPARALLGPVVVVSFTVTVIVALTPS